MLAGAGVVPAAGDIVLARVLEIGQHQRLESPASRRQMLFPGDEILVAYGHRYAPDQFLAEVPETLGPCHLIAAGGLAGQVVAQHASMDEPTAIEVLGLLTDSDGTVTLGRLAPHRVRSWPGGLPTRPPVIAVLGTSMNSGKSTTLGCLVNGLVNAGLTVSAGKATGTGAGNDSRLFADAGASRVLDFTDFGFPTTFNCEYELVRDLLPSLVDALSSADTDVVVVEIADGLYQGETRRLLADPVFRETVDQVVFSAADALGATAGLQLLHNAGLTVGAVSGRLTASPLASGEAAAVLPVQVIDTYDLCGANVAMGLLPRRHWPLQ
ncbi:DUF1611 domain-containing protein [Arthrobacter silvisoli]|uniref:DUF1611 domain-containing protein n=1 Tax=Arthrobacter silvisoli TaxID=2291022 RepID=UPI001B345CE1|nr:DUF1611 domain-containing protein [Arthrobacter silvisoli]